MDIYDKAVALWRQRGIKNSAELAEALNGHSIAFVYHSGKIENERITYNNVREIFEHYGVTSYTGDLRTLFEIRNAKEANELLHEAFDARRLLDEKQDLEPMILYLKEQTVKTWRKQIERAERG